MSLTEGVDGSGTTEGPGTVDVTGEPPTVDWCLRGATQAALDTQDTLWAIVDTDGNGRDEVWMTRYQWDPVAELQSTRIFAYELQDGALERVVDLLRPGAATGMADIDGDGRLDLMMRQWDEPDAWWLAGQPGPSIDDAPRPLDRFDTVGTFIDANGDGFVDSFSLEEMGVSLHVGDGAGGFSPTDDLAYEGDLGSAHVSPSGTPGRLLVRFEALVLGFGSDLTQLRAIAVSPAGEITTLAESDGLDIEVVHVRDFDGDEVPDVLGYDPLLNMSLIYVHRDPAGAYTVEATDDAVYGMVADTLTDPDEVGVMHWATEESEVWYRPREDGAWPTAYPVTIEGPWRWSGIFQTMQADGESGKEILGLTYGEVPTFVLWRLEPCS